MKSQLLARCNRVGPFLGLVCYRLSWHNDELIIHRMTGQEITENYHTREETVQEFSATREECLNLVVHILSMLEGKTTPDGQNMVIGHINADAAMVRNGSFH